MKETLEVIIKNLVDNIPVQDNKRYRDPYIACLPAFRQYARRNDSNGSFKIGFRRLCVGYPGGGGALFQPFPPAYTNIYFHNTFAYVYKRGNRVTGGI